MMLARTFGTATGQSQGKEVEAVVEDAEVDTGVAIGIATRQAVSPDREGQAQTSPEPPSHQSQEEGNNEETPVGGRLARFGERWNFNP